MGALSEFGWTRLHILHIWTCAAVISGCAIGLSDQIEQIEPGMSDDRVVEILGQPDQRMVEGAYEALKWSNQLVRVDPPDEPGYWVPSHYWVVFREGRVQESGYGNVRVAGEPPALVLVPIDSRRPPPP